MCAVLIIQHGIRKTEIARHVYTVWQLDKSFLISIWSLVEIHIPIKSTGVWQIYNGRTETDDNQPVTAWSKLQLARHTDEHQSKNCF